MRATRVSPSHARACTRPLWRARQLDNACPRCAEATRLYGLALEIAASSSGTDVATVASVLLANRSAALLKQGQPLAALRDACACVQVRPVHKFPGRPGRWPRLVIASILCRAGGTNLRKGLAAHGRCAGTAATMGRCSKSPRQGGCPCSHARPGVQGRPAPEGQLLINRTCSCKTLRKVLYARPANTCATCSCKALLCSEQAVFPHKPAGPQHQLQHALSLPLVAVLH